MFLFGENRMSESFSEAMAFQELLKFPLISRFCFGFETQLMNTTKFSCTVSKLDSHSMQQ